MPGYDVRTTEPVKVGLQCPQCNLLLREAVQTPDGTRLCESCFKEIAESPGHTSQKTGISVIDESGKPWSYPDRAVRREIQKIEVFCRNSVYGCPWIGLLGSYTETHEKECRFKPVSCPNKSKGCEILLAPTEVEKHLRKECNYREVGCEYCREIMMPAALKEHYNKKCPRYPVQCSLCSQDVVRENLKDHEQNACPKIRCSCKQVLNREGDESDSNSIAGHLKTPATVLYHILGVLSLGYSIMENMKGFESRLSALEARGVGGGIPMNVVQRSELAKVHAEAQQNAKVMMDRIEPLEHYIRSSKDKNLHSKIQEIQSSVTYFDDRIKQQEGALRTIQSQLQHPRKTETHSYQYSTGDSSRIMMLEQKYEELERQMSMVKVHVSELELQLQASLASTHNGSFLWRIPDLGRRRRDAIDERITSIYSPPFYTGRNGYKMCIRAYLNGDGMGHKTHISLFFVIMKGEFDALLKWPFEHKVSLILVDQNHRKHIVQTFKPTPESSSFQRPVTDMNVASGCPQFTKLNVLDDDSYVKDDTIYFKCIVDTSKVFHP